MSDRRTGLVLESATEHVEVAVLKDDEPLAHVREEVGHGHTRRLTSLAAQALESAGVPPASLGWIAADLGPGSFTGVRVGLATASALALASGARIAGVSSLAALAHSAGARSALVVPLVPAGRRDLYSGWFRADARGSVKLLAAPRVGDLDSVLATVDEIVGWLAGAEVRFVGPGAARERARLEGAYAGSTFPAWRHEGLSALDLARVATAGGGVAAGLPPAGSLEPLYVRPAQAEERVRRKALAGIPLAIRDFTRGDIRAAAALERRVFSDPWPESFFAGELDQPLAYARVAERGDAGDPSRPADAFAGYLLAWLGDQEGHLGNLAVAPEHRRAGVARALVDDLLAAARSRGTRAITLEVRVSNFAAQSLYRAHGFRLAGLRRGYYRDTGEDALLMTWRDSDQA